MAIKHAKVQHVVAIPYPAQGHINPLLQLCQQLVPHGFTFTFVNTHHIHRRVQGASSGNNVELDGHTLQDADAHDSQHANGHSNGHAHTINSTHDHGGNHALHVLEGEDVDNIKVNQQLGEDAHANDEGNIMQIQAHQKLKGCNPIRMVFVEGGCAPEEHAHIATTKDAFMAAQNMKEQVEQLISDIVEEQPVAFILTDILFGWSEATASKFKLPWVCFWAASAATCAAFIHFADLGEQGKSVPIAGQQDGHVPTIEGIPGLPPTRLHDLPKVWDDTGILRYEILRYFHAAEKARFLLFNTFAELEDQVLQALAKRYSTLAVGPLLPSSYIMQSEAEGQLPRPDRTASKEDGLLCRASLFREDRTCLDWLDKQAPSSVLFISFGSISARSNEQLEELGHAVEASGCPFLWVRRPDISTDFAPASGLGAQRGNGLIVPWAPQLDVLSHPAVGGFVTHCGWNSIMESVAMGVPMLCWADTGERMSNQRFVVQFWKCGVDMVSDGRRYTQHIDEAVLVRRDEIEKCIRWLLLEEAGAPVRARAAHLRDAASLAFRNSHSHFNQFVQAMHALQ